MCVGVFADNLKMAEVVPIFKSGGNGNPNISAENTTD